MEQALLTQGILKIIITRIIIKRRCHQLERAERTHRHRADLMMRFFLQPRVNRHVTRMAMRLATDRFHKEANVPLEMQTKS